MATRRERIERELLGALGLHRLHAYECRQREHGEAICPTLLDALDAACQPREVDREKLERVLSRHFEQTQTGTTWNQAKDDLMAWATGERVRACAHEGEIEVNVQHRDKQGNVVPYRQRVLVDLLTMTGTCPICGAKRP